MITKDQYIQPISHELEVIRHLAVKLKESDLDYKPTAGQRTVLELLQYMSYIFDVGVETIQSGNMELFKPRSEEAKSLRLADFDAKIADQIIAIHKTISGMTEQDFAEDIDMWGVQTRAMHLLNGPLKWATAYKMQLFLYMKALGYHHLNTMNVWAGMDPK
jgi:hypothetical protein